MKTVGQELEALIERQYGHRGKKMASESLGISPAYLSDICNDRRGISAEMAVRISRVMGAGLGERLYRRHCALDLERARVGDGD